jgi:signal transduction histidine kinase/ActR/RegA family two-component response regulator
MSIEVDVRQELERLRASEAKLTALTDGSRRLMSALNSSRLADEVLRLAQQSIAADGYAVWRLEQGTWRVSACVGMDPAFAETQIRGDAPPAYSGPTFVEDVMAAPWLESRREAYRQSGVTSMLSVPLIMHGRPEGSIVYYFRRPYRPDAIDLKVAEALGHLAAAAMSSAELYAEQQKTAAENTRLFEQSQESNRSKDEFLAALSHELRTPLNAILGWTSILRSSPNADLARGLEVIHRNAKAQTRLVDELLDASRIESGKMALDFKETALAAAVQAAVETTMTTAAERSITVKVSGPTDAKVWGDPGRLQQVFWNLLANAVKFTEGGGSIDVAMRSTATEAVVVVRDSGIGIPREALPFVFERFRQANAETTKRYRGLGLGLSLARQLTQMHGGRITAASDGPGRGATFTVYLPLLGATTRAAQPQGPSTASTVLSGVRIVAVDDDPDALEVLTKVLKLCGADVVGVATAQRALDQLRRGRASLLISDIAMPDQDGFWLLEQVRRQPHDRGGDIPAIAVSAFADVNTQMRVSSAGFAAYLSKPLHPDALVNEVRRVLQRE